MIAEKNDTYYSVFKNPDNHSPALWVSKRISLRDRTIAPVLAKPKLRGYYVITSNMIFISDLLTKIKIGKNGFFILTNSEGEILSAPEFIGDKIITNRTFEKVNFGTVRWADIKKAHSTIQTVLGDNKNYIINAENIHKNIYLVAVLSEDEFISGSNAIKTAVAIITLTSLLIMFILRKILIHPINLLNKATTDIALGHLDANIDIKSNDEIGMLATSFNNMANNLKESSDQVKYLAYHDNLTGLPNRLMFKEYLEPILARAKRNKEIFAILFLDLDDFKRVNDSLGHKAGDKLLQNVSMKLSNCVRDEDFISRSNEKIDYSTNIVARLGGDEFIILLTDIDKPYSASIVAERILTEFKKPEFIENHELYISTSIGISIYPYDGDTSDTLIKNADLAMYDAKNEGKNIYKNFSTSLNDSAKRRLNMDTKLRKAVENGDFILHYQPQINLETNKINGVEALIRWNDQEEGMIPPNTFINIAEENGLIMQITEWVLFESCRQNMAWQDAGLPHINVSSNISGVDIARRDLNSLIKKSIDLTKINPKYVEIELTESVMMSTTYDVVGIR
jgi:diguanylate cyclase (GGDEF)-like protein